MERIIYALKCPVTDRVHYIGKSTQGMRRPMQHLKRSHSEKVVEWVDDLKLLGHKPTIMILQNVQEWEDIDITERVWISSYIDSGAILLNENLVTPMTIRPDIDKLTDSDAMCDYRAVGRFIAEKRKDVGLTQEQFADRAGVAVTVLRKIEQGHSNIVLDKLLTILSMFGCSLAVKKI